MFGQDYNKRAYATAASDMLMKEVSQNGGGDAVRFGDSLVEDGFADDTFDYFLTNPPFGVDWKRQRDAVRREHEQRGFAGRFGAGLPRVNDGALLFLQHMMFEAKTLEGYKICEPGDLVINTLWAWMGAMGVSFVPGVVSPAYNVYEPTVELDPAYVDALSRLPVFAQEAARHSKGVWSSRLRLYPDGFFEISLPVPPLSEQRQIAANLAAGLRKLDGLARAATCTIGLLMERRAALIAVAVAGRTVANGRSSR